MEPCTTAPVYILLYGWVYISFDVGYLWYSIAVTEVVALDDEPGPSRAGHLQPLQPHCHTLHPGEVGEVMAAKLHTAWKAAPCPHQEGQCPQQRLKAV